MSDILKNITSLPKSNYTKIIGLKGTDGVTQNITIPEDGIITLTAYRGGMLTIYSGSNVITGVISTNANPVFSCANTALVNKGTYTIYYQGIEGTSEAGVFLWT